MEVVVVGAGLGGLSAACHLRGAGHDVHGARGRATSRAGGPARSSSWRVPVRHRTDGADDAATWSSSASRPPAPTSPTTSTLRRVDPMYRAVLRRRLRAAGPPRSRGHDRGDPRGRAAPREAAALRPLLRLARRAVPSSRCRTSSTATSTPRSTCARPPRARARARPPRCLRPAGDAVAGVLRRRAAAADLQLPGDVRRPRPLRGARDVRRHHLHGHRQRRVRPRRRHARAARRWPTPPRRPGSSSATATRSSASCSRDGTRGPVQGVRLAGGEVLRADAVVCNRRPARRLPELLPGLDAPRVARRGTTRRRASCGTSACAASCRPGRRTTTSTSAASGAARSTRCSSDGAAHARPVGPRDRAHLDDPAWRPPGGHALYVLEPAPNLDGTVDWTAEQPAARGLAGAVAGVHGLPGDDVEVEALVDPLDWEARAWSGARRSRCPTASSRPGRSGPANVDRRAAGPGLRRLGHGARRRRPDGARLRRASPPSGSRGSTRRRCAPVTRSRSPTSLPRAEQGATARPTTGRRWSCRA